MKPQHVEITTQRLEYLERCAENVQKLNHEICQILGEALHYPRYCDDEENFPDATKADGVCVGEHVAETLAKEAADCIKALERLREMWEKKETFKLDDAGSRIEYTEIIECHGEYTRVNTRINVEASNKDWSDLVDKIINNEWIKIEFNDRSMIVNATSTSFNFDGSRSFNFVGKDSIYDSKFSMITVQERIRRAARAVLEADARGQGQPYAEAMSALRVALIDSGVYVDDGQGGLQK